jgi:hypothetical protein
LIPEEEMAEESNDVASSALNNARLWARIARRVLDITSSKDLTRATGAAHRTALNWTRRVIFARPILNTRRYCVDVPTENGGRRRTTRGSYGRTISRWQRTAISTSRLWLTEYFSSHRSGKP